MNISQHVRTSIVLLVMSSAAMAGCAAETDLEAYEDQDGSEDIDETQQALTGTCNYGPTATFRFRGKIRTYFTANGDSTKHFEYDYLCGNGTTDTCGPVWIGPHIPGKTWQSHNMEPAANVLSNRWGCR